MTSRWPVVETDSIDADSNKCIQNDENDKKQPFHHLSQPFVLVTCKTTIMPNSFCTSNDSLMSTVLAFKGESKCYMKWIISRDWFFFRAIDFKHGNGAIVSHVARSGSPFTK